jgi:hypothetical protein
MTISLKHSFTSAVADGSTLWVGTLTSGTNTITSVSPTPTSALVGYRLYNANIPAGTTISSVSGTTITMSANATGSATGATIYTDDSLVQASDWNAEHTLTLATGKLLGRSTAGTGAAEEISVGTGLTLSGGTLSSSSSATLTPGTTATSGGAAGQIMFDTGSVLQESSNLVWDNTNKALTLTGATLTGATSYPVLNMTQTWNNATTVFTATKLNVTDTTSSSSSLLMDLQVGAVSKFSVRKDGIVRVPSQAAVGGGATTSAIGSATATGIYFSNDSWVGVQVSNASIFTFVPDTFYMQNNAYLGWTSGTYPGYNSINGDLFLSRRGAANIRLGKPDAASPVAQTLSVQSVVAGTTDTAGANLTITGSQGTGTGAGGNIIFQVATAGSTGSTQNALATALKINSDKTITAASYFTAFSFQSTDSIFLSGNKFYVRGSTGVVASSDQSFGFSSGTGNANSGSDTLLTRRAAANLRFGAADAASPVAQTLSVQSVVAGTSNTAGANLTITGSQGTGTGVGGNIIFQVAPAGTTGTAQNALATAMTIRNDKTVQLTGFTVATLPTAGTAGRFAYVTDATVPTWNGTLTGGGAVTVLVMDNGTNWVAM